MAARGEGAGRKKRESPATIDQDLVRAVSHPVRVRILEALHGRQASPVELSRALGSSLGVVAYHVRALSSAGVIEETGSRQVRGTVEHFWTAVPRSFIGHQDWRRVPIPLRTGVTREALRTFVDRVAAAVGAGTIDGREDTTLNWMPITVDGQGWLEVAELMAGTLHDLQRIGRESRDRLGKRDGTPIVTGLAAFEIPPDPPRC